MTRKLSNKELAAMFANRRALPKRSLSIKEVREDELRENRLLSGEPVFDKSRPFSSFQTEASMARFEDRDVIKFPPFERQGELKEFFKKTRPINVIIE